MKSKTMPDRIEIVDLGRLIPKCAQRAKGLFQVRLVAEGAPNLLVCRLGGSGIIALPALEYAKRGAMQGNAWPCVENDAAGQNLGQPGCGLGPDNVTCRVRGAKWTRTWTCRSIIGEHLTESVKAGGHWSTHIVWGTSTFTLGGADYQRQYLPILYGWREGESIIGAAHATKETYGSSISFMLTICIPQ